MKVILLQIMVQEQADRPQTGHAAPAFSKTTSSQSVGAGVKTACAHHSAGARLEDPCNTKSGLPKHSGRVSQTQSLCTVQRDECLSLPAHS